VNVPAFLLTVFLAGALGGVAARAEGAGSPPPHGPAPAGDPARADAAAADLVVIDKSLHRLSLFAHGRLLRAYQVALGGGGLGPKVRAGDRRTPEGRYVIDGRNPHSAYHMSLHISYPDAHDLAEAAARGVAPGGDIMIHGLKNGLGWIGSAHRRFDWTAGCVGVTDAEIEEIWRLVPDGTAVLIRR
jgi:murein L,D-transpeptidase YafK